MAAAISNAMRPRLRCVAVIAEPQLWRKNRMTHHLEQRGLEVVREASATNAPHSMHDVSVVVMQMSNSRPSDVARWKAAADAGTARFFVVPHERNKGAWVSLDEWLSRALTGREAIGGDEPPNASHTAALLRSQATIAELEGEVDTLKRENATMRDNIVTGNAERDGLRATCEAEKERANRLATHYAARDKQVTELKGALENVIASRDREIETLKAKLAEKPLPAANLKATMLDALGWLLPEMTEESRAFAEKLRDLVTDGILEPSEARTKYFARYGGGK